MRQVEEDELDDALLASGPRKIVRPTSNLRTNVELPYVWFSSGTPKKILPFYRADALTVLVSRLSTVIYPSRQYACTPKSCGGTCPPGCSDIPIRSAAVRYFPGRPYKRPVSGGELG